MLEEAWEAIRWDMPSIWIVIVQELPEEREERKSALFEENGGGSTRFSIASKALQHDTSKRRSMTHVDNQVCSFRDDAIGAGSPT